MKTVQKNQSNNNETDTVGILHNQKNAEKILKITTDTLFLLSKDGVCVDIALNTDQWFLQDADYFIGKNIFELLPSETATTLKKDFDKVVSTGNTSTENYEMQVAGKSLFFKCIIHVYNENLVLCQYSDITKRILLKQRLQIMNQELQDIEGVAQIAQWTFNIKTKEFQIKGFSGGIASNNEITTITLQDYIEFLHPNDRLKLIEFIENNCKAINHNYLDYHLILKDAIIYFRIKVIQGFIKDEIRFLKGYVQNISDIMHKQSELEIVTQAVENSTDYIFAMRKNGQFVFGNRKYKEYNGWKSNDDITKYNFFDTYSRDQGRTRWIDIIRQLTSTNQILNFVIPKPLPIKPEILAFDCTSYYVQDSIGDDLIWTFGKDITEHVQYEKQVKELNQIMSAVLTNIPMAISVKDVDDNFKYIYSNRNGDLDYWGTSDNIIGKTDYDIYSDQIADKIRLDDVDLVQKDCAVRKIIEGHDKQGQRVVKDQLRILVKDRIRSLLIFIERDITKDKEMEQELIDAKEKAEQSDKFKSAFIANMSHEIRTPLNAILGFSKIIVETQDVKERKEYFNIVESNNNRLLGLVDEILDLSKIESGIMEFVPEKIRLSPFCYDLVLKLSLHCLTGVKLVFEESDPNLVIKSDRNRLTQVFKNLIENAAKFTKEGCISFGYELKNDYLEFYVKDTGLGIPSDKIDSVFERFVQVNEFIQGTGLGLPICKSIIERMGGGITVQSELGVGSCFTFTLPESCVIGDRTLAKSSSDETKKKETVILVAEDTDINYFLIEIMIGRIYKLKRDHR